MSSSNEIVNSVCVVFFIFMMLHIFDTATNIAYYLLAMHCLLPIDCLLLIPIAYRTQSTKALVGICVVD